MKFELHVHVHHVSPPSDPALALLIHQGKKIIMSLQNLITEVSETKAVATSAIALLQGLKTKLDEAIASGDPAKLQELADSLDASTNELATAITANTPAGTPTDSAK